MSHYHHLNIEERENLLILKTKGLSVRKIAKELNRSVSTVSRELKRNKCSKKKEYRATKAQVRYYEKRKSCKRKKLLDNPELYSMVKTLISVQGWSPEQISHRLKYEKNHLQISYATIYRAINNRVFDERKIRKKMRGFKKYLRRKGKPRHLHNYQENRGYMAISNSIEDRPLTADKRKVVGHWEADTVVGAKSSGSIVTLVDRKTRFLLAKKLSICQAENVANAMIGLFSTLEPHQVKSITPDRGKEFTYHKNVTEALNGVPFYFAHPHSPWERPTNENTNGLLRQYLPKRTSFEDFSDEDVQKFVLLINLRPRKCLGWKSAFEVFFHKVLHLT